MPDGLCLDMLLDKNNHDATGMIYNVLSAVLLLVVDIFPMQSETLIT